MKNIQNHRMRCLVSNGHKMSTMALSKRQKVGNFACYSRIMVILMQAFFNFLLPDHDAKVFSPPDVSRHNKIDYIVELLLGGFRRWDAVYLLHIAEYGYTYENTLAFFPLFPLIVSVLANTVFFPLQYCMNYRNVLLVSATIFNVICFIQAAKYLCDLTMKVIDNQRIALKVVQLFCLNPASIFFSAPYTEVLYAMCSFCGMLYVEDDHFITAAGCFALSGATRSNGIINIAFIWYRQLKNLIEFAQNSVHDKKSILLKFTKAVLQTILCTVIVVVPFILFQLYASKLYCNLFASYKDLPHHVLNYGNSQRYKMPHTGVAPWCRYSIPISYSYVQKTHWNVGFLSYYQLKQIPNFLLAMPVVLIGLSAFVSYLRHNPWCCMTLALVEPSMASNKKYDDPVWLPRTSFGYNSRRNFVYLIHMMALIIFGILFMHVQVLTRFICCSCPIFYFFLAWITSSKEDQLGRPQTTTNNGNAAMVDSAHDQQTESAIMDDDDATVQAFLEWENSWQNRLIYVYLHMYFFIGIAAFSNFLPWT